jgi:hypothetical protein
MAGEALGIEARTGGAVLDDLSHPEGGDDPRGRHRMGRELTRAPDSGRRGRANAPADPGHAGTWSAPMPALVTGGSELEAGSTS